MLKWFLTLPYFPHPSSQKEEVKPEKLGASCHRGRLLQVVFPEMCKRSWYRTWGWWYGLKLLCLPGGQTRGRVLRGWWKRKPVWLSLSSCGCSENPSCNLHSFPEAAGTVSENWDQAAGTATKGQGGTGGAIRWTLGSHLTLVGFTWEFRALVKICSMWGKSCQEWQPKWVMLGSNVFVLQVFGVAS